MLEIKELNITYGKRNIINTSCGGNYYYVWPFILL